MEWIVILQIVCIFIFSLWKAYIGPMLSAAFGFSYLPMLLINILAVLFSVFLTLALNNYLVNHHQKPPSGYNKHLKTALRYWKRYGRIGAGFLAPVLLGIPVYSFIAARLRTPSKQIYIDVIAWTAFWLTLFYLLAMQGLLIVDEWVSLPEWINP